MSGYEENVTSQFYSNVFNCLRLPSGNLAKVPVPLPVELLVTLPVTLQVTLPVTLPVRLPGRLTAVHPALLVQ